jgi:hypothetical protein
MQCLQLPFKSEGTSFMDTLYPGFAVPDYALCLLAGARYRRLCLNTRGLDSGHSVSLGLQHGLNGGARRRRRICVTALHIERSYSGESVEGTERSREPLRGAAYVQVNAVLLRQLP